MRSIATRMWAGEGSQDNGPDHRLLNLKYLNTLKKFTCTEKKWFNLSYPTQYTSFGVLQQAPVHCLVLSLPQTRKSNLQITQKSPFQPKKSFKAVPRPGFNPTPGTVPSFGLLKAASSQTHPWPQGKSSSCSCSGFSRKLPKNTPKMRLQLPTWRQLLGRWP